MGRTELRPAAPGHPPATADGSPTVPTVAPSKRPSRRARQAGTVYLYNLHREPAEVATNGRTVGTVDGWDDENSYAPAHVPIPRAHPHDPGLGELREGRNDFRITWTSATSTSDEFYIPYGPDRVALSEDIVCLVTIRFAWVLDEPGFGSVIPLHLEWI